MLYNKNMAQFIPHITPIMMREQPDQVCDIINRIIDELNKIKN